MARPTGGSGTTTRPGAPVRPPARPAADPAVRVARTRLFFRGLVQEMRRVTWPTRREWVSATILTIALVVVLGLYTYGVDQFFGWLFSFVHR